MVSAGLAALLHTTTFLDAGTRDDLPELAAVLGVLCRMTPRGRGRFAGIMGLLVTTSGRLRLDRPGPWWMKRRAASPTGHRSGVRRCGRSP